MLKGNCTSGGTCIAPEDSFIIQDSSDDTVAYIDSEGNMCLETGDCSDQSVSCENPEDAFIVRNGTDDNVIYIDKNGDLCLIGKLYEDAFVF